MNPTGAFAVSSPYVWDLSNLYTTGEVMFLAAAGVPGDFNNDSAVDAGGLRRVAERPRHALTRKPPTTCGVHTSGQYLRALGPAAARRYPPPSPLSAAVPEPSSLLLVTMAAAGLFWRRRVATGRLRLHAIEKGEGKQTQHVDRRKQRRPLRSRRQADPSAAHGRPVPLGLRARSTADFIVTQTEQEKENDDEILV